MDLLCAIALSFFPVIFFVRAKIKRDTTGVVRTREYFLFIVSIPVAIISWIKVLSQWNSF